MRNKTSGRRSRRTGGKKKDCAGATPANVKCFIIMIIMIVQIIMVIFEAQYEGR